MFNDKIDESRKLAENPRTRGDKEKLEDIRQLYDLLERDDDMDAEKRVHFDFNEDLAYNG